MSLSLRCSVPRFLIPAAVLLAIPAAAQGGDAQADDTGTGVTLGLRASYGIPSGDFYDGFSLDERFSGVFAPQVDLGYFINRHVYLGIYGQFGSARIQSDACPTGVDCSGRVLRFGVDVSYHFIPDSVLSPWLGAGLGYEFTRISASAAGSTGAGNYKGLEFAHVEAGLEIRVAEHVWLGPCFIATLGQYSRATMTIDGLELSGEIEDKSPHFWLQPGVRLQVRL
ncbi:outer membrane beta-barrel protein [Myxococcus sp. Y35]|uniref:outer membrane beta-barrel protein n=1 Tax=Pseudomyxococcus flavus TaxID=3115648 RepID=UPI003CF647CC